jgi:uncharacterized membrane protein SpoIIM required for sporulation
MATASPVTSWLTCGRLLGRTIAGVDIDAYIAAHSGSWARLEYLLRRARSPRRCSGAELDELVDLYQRTATHLSVIRSASPDPMLVARLSRLVARARSAVAGGGGSGWRDLARFVNVTFPVAVYHARWWVLGVTASFCAVATALGVWIAMNPAVQRTIAAPDEVRQLAERDFEAYYSSHPATSFAAQVFTNNAQVGALAFAFGILLGLPTLYVLLQNAVNVGIAGGLMASAGRLDKFFGLILPHGMLELTAVFIAGAMGLRLGWTVIDPGVRSRSEALGEVGRASVAVVIGLVGVFFVAGLIEAFVTPSGLPTWTRVGIGLVVEAAFLLYIGVLGRRAARAGETGDLVSDLRGDRMPTAA